MQELAVQKMYIIINIAFAFNKKGHLYLACSSLLPLFPLYWYMLDWYSVQIAAGEKGGRAATLHGLTVKLANK